MKPETVKLIRAVQELRPDLAMNEDVIQFTCKQYIAACPPVDFEPPLVKACRKAVRKK